MPLEYTNRKGDRYYVLQGRTKTGKPKFYCSRKPDGTRIDELPAGFEIYEHPQSAVVTVRKVRPSRLLPSEVEFLKEQIRIQSGIEHVIVDRTGDSMVIYVCDRNPDEVNQLLNLMLVPLKAHAESNRQWVLAHAAYSPAFRFTLVDEDERLFQAERWCYRSRIDDWIPLSSPDRTLDELAQVSSAPGTRVVFRPDLNECSVMAITNRERVRIGYEQSRQPRRGGRHRVADRWALLAVVRCSSPADGWGRRVGPRWGRFR